VGLNVLWGWNRIEYSPDYNLYGWLTIANGGLALILGARNNLLAVVARIPSSTILLYHRWVGLATAVHATIHFSLNVRPWIRSSQVADVFHNSRIQIGLMAWVSLCLIVITSISYIRRRYFEAFYYPHALFIVFAVGAMIHASHGPEFLLPGLALWCIDRLIRFVHNFRSINVQMAEQYPGDLTKLKFRGFQTTYPGQIVWVQIPGVSFLNWHPFTVASAPGDEEAAVAIRGLGAYTKRLHSLVKSTKGMQGGGEGQELHPFKVRVDGPYGVGHVMWGVHPVTILVAGGIGITPGISIMSYIVHRACRPDVNVDGRQQWHIHLLWVIKDKQHVEWFAEELKNLATIASAPSVPLTLDITIHITGRERPQLERHETGDAYEMEGVRDYEGIGTVIPGRPNVLKWFEGVKMNSYGLDAVVNACGPRPLVNAVRKAAAKVSDKSGVFYVEEEEFEF
jgi:NADPH oxidase 2